MKNPSSHLGVCPLSRFCACAHTCRTRPARFALAGGYLAHSLAIMTDAAHLLADVGSMVGSLFSLWLSTRPATRTMTFGWHRSGKAPARSGDPPVLPEGTR